MDEFIKKLIERLEENTVMMANSKEFWDNPQNGEHVSEVIPIEKAISIVNELAEEYSHRTEDLVIEDSHRNGWIPCSERLPESDYMCLVTVEYPSGKNRS